MPDARIGRGLIQSQFLQHERQRAKPPGNLSNGGGAASLIRGEDDA